MNAYKLRRFHALVIFQYVHWYGKYAISYRQLEGDDGGTRRRRRSHDHLAVDSGLRPAAGEKAIRWYQGYTSGSWRVDETCIRVNGVKA